MTRPWIRRIGRITIATVVVAAFVLPLVLLVALPDAAAAVLTWIAKILPPLSLPLVVVLSVEAALLLLAAIWWLWWRLPKRQVHGLDIQIHDPKARADTEDNFRKTVGQALGGTAVLIGAAAAYLQFTQQQQAARDQLQASHELLISNQVSKGFEQLGSKEVATRLGGIYALEGVIDTSDQYHQPVLQGLCAFVRESTKPKAEVKTGKSPSGPPKVEVPATDVQAALTVIGRRKPGAGDVNLVEANIPGANLSGANLSGADLGSADLSSASLTGATLSSARLSGADLRAANLSGAFLGANLNATDLSGANLSNADLSAAENFTQAQLDQTCGKPHALPPGLNSEKLKPCPPR
jgi:hypothetical protein